MNQAAGGPKGKPPSNAKNESGEALALSPDRANPANAIPIFAMGMPPGLSPDRAARNAIPIRMVNGPPVTGDRAREANAIPVYVLGSPPVTGGRANPDNAIPCYTVMTAPTDPTRAARNAIPVYAIP